MTSHYASELDQLPKTYEAALKADVAQLKEAVTSFSRSSVIAVGSGGSFTVASLLCSLHEAYTGRVSRASTPLEIICNPGLAATSPVILISAEGKNPDITSALQRVRLHSARQIHVLTNRKESNLMQLASSSSGVATHLYPLDQKDGYLATNSLLFDSILVARAYEELDRRTNTFAENLTEMLSRHESKEEWNENLERFAEKSCAAQNLIVIYSPQLKPIAIDLESKLSESALLHSQVIDLRSFAHGRHLWIAQRPKECAIIAIIEPTLRPLWDQMKLALPDTVPTMELLLRSSQPVDLIVGLVAQMDFVGYLGKSQNKDPGRPEVPEFGRTLYYTKVESLISDPQPVSDSTCLIKAEVLGAAWPSRPSMNQLLQTSILFQQQFHEHKFRAVVFDYDGTLCASQSRDAPPSAAITAHLVRLLTSGVVVGIASGRGGSIRDSMRSVLPEEFWHRVVLGLYNGGEISLLSDEKNLLDRQDISELLNHVIRIANRLKENGAPIKHLKATHPHQVSIRLVEGASADEMWVVTTDALRNAGLTSTSVVKSKHSVDILSPGVSKSHLVGFIADEFRINPYELLSIGDQGAWPGNDHALLEHKYSLSVDIPSRRLDRGWKLAPIQFRDVDATLWYMNRFVCNTDCAFLLDLSAGEVGVEVINER